MTVRMARRHWLVGLLSVLFVATYGWPAAVAAEQDGDGFPWIVEPTRAAELIEADEVDILDTRDRSSWQAGHLPGAVPIDWEEFTPEAKPDRGELREETATLQETLRKLGIDADRPVLVVGNPPDNWGEDGRIVWMLRTLGHEAVALVDGGHGAVLEAGIEPSRASPDPEAGDFEVDGRDTWSIGRAAVLELVEQSPDDLVVIDTRSAREYRGETPYGESRSGHLPGAKHLHYRALLDDDGRLLPDDEIREQLAERGVDANSRVIAYCTGGIRSAWLTVVLVHLGYERAANYPGSAWDWSAGGEEKYPLVGEKNGE